jgi:hypothetical protein
MGWVINATRGKNTDSRREGGLVGLGQYERVWKNKILAPTGTRIPDRPNRTVLLCQLRYRSPISVKGKRL